MKPKEPGVPIRLGLTTSIAPGVSTANNWSMPKFQPERFSTNVKKPSRSASAAKALAIQRRVDPASGATSRIKATPTSVRQRAALVFIVIVLRPRCDK